MSKILRKRFSMLVLVVLAFALSGALLGCRDAERKLNAKLWKIEPGLNDPEPSIYRIVKKPNGQEVEQFYYIRSNPEKMKEFACMLASDRKELYDTWNRCGCSL